jgi:hypothetical protein
MHPPPIYPELSHLQNHVLAMLACIAPFRNMRLPAVYWSHLKRSFWSGDFLLKYHQNPSRDEAKKKKRGREKKLQESSNKEELIFWEKKKHFDFKNPFQCDSIFSPSIILFQKPFPESLRKFSQLVLDHPLAWQYTWLEMYHFPLPTSSTYLAFRG